MTFSKEILSSVVSGIERMLSSGKKILGMFKIDKGSSNDTMLSIFLAKKHLVMLGDSGGYHSLEQVVIDNLT